MTLVTEDKSRK